MAKPAWAKQYNKSAKAKRKRSGGWGGKRRGRGFRIFGIRLW